VTLLRLTGINKAFLGVQALSDVDFDLQAGEIHALLGENGAGKSTLVKVLTGVYAKDGGTLTLDGVPRIFTGSADARRAGVSAVYQEVNLVPNLSVAHNLFLGREPRRFGCVRHGEMRRQARAVLEPFDLGIDVSQPLGRFSLAVQQLVAIARGVSESATVLVLDEPTASLDNHEVDTLFGILDRLRRNGMGIVFVTHFLEQVYRLCDRITVLRNGRVAGCWPTSELPRERLVAQMLGKELAQTAALANGATESANAVLLEAENVAVKHALRPFSLAIRGGEAVGLAGLLGSGRTEVCRALFALDRLKSGVIRMAGTRVRQRRPADAIRNGMALCPEDRKAQGIVGPLSVAENVILALQAKRGWFNPIGKDERRALVDKMIAELGIKAADTRQPVEQLSGGNQQKVILARWLLTKPRLLILDEPTRGIDVGAHAEIIRMIGALRAEGMSLLVTSSELEELVRFADRVVVMRDRHKAAELTGDAVSESHIMAAIAAPEAVTDAAA
jgi:simple sugar transport system ATP-binding protein